MSLRVEPLPRGGGFEFVDATKGGVIPHNLMPAVRKGVEQVLALGAVAGFPLQDVRVTVFDGKHHPVDSKEIAFVTAGRKAFLEAIAKARPTVLEPIVSVEIVCPEANTGDIAGDLSTRRGQVTGTKAAGPGALAITGVAPLVELDGYAARLKSVTGGPRRVHDGALALRGGPGDAAAAARRGVREEAQARGRLGSVRAPDASRSRADRSGDDGSGRVRRGGGRPAVRRRCPVPAQAGAGFPGGTALPPRR